MPYNSVMRFSTISLAAFPSLALGHDGGFPMPRLMGARGLGALKGRNAFIPRAADPKPEPAPGTLQARQGRCGSGFGSCGAGLCCSAAGYCGTGTEYCAAPDCQFQYGPACDANIVPAGGSTSGVARTKVNNGIPYGGAGIYSCTVPGTVALTYDDGPYIYTEALLNLLDQFNAKATFFITGINLGKGAIDDASKPWKALIQRMYNSNHQVASHTWSHQDLSTLTQAQRRNQMYYNEMALRNILGVFPTYMRPPYSSCTTGCQNDMNTLGYHISYFDLDTEDYIYNTPETNQVAKNDFSGNMSTRHNPSTDEWLVIAHDIQATTVNSLSQFMLQTLQNYGFRAVTMGECLGDPKANWYRAAGGGGGSSTSTSQPPPTSTSGPVSQDGHCGAGFGGTVCTGSSFGNCCSQYGWCGSTTDHCGTGCQPTFGTCSGSGTSSSPPPSGTSKPVSQDGHCGASFGGTTCQNSAFGNCCSQYNWCGSTTDHCSLSNGCQTTYGTCS